MKPFDREAFIAMLDNRFKSYGLEPNQIPMLAAAVIDDGLFAAEEVAGRKQDDLFEVVFQLVRVAGDGCYHGASIARFSKNMPIAKDQLLPSGMVKGGVLDKTNSRHGCFVFSLSAEGWWGSVYELKKRDGHFQIGKPWAEMGAKGNLEELYAESVETFDEALRAAKEDMPTVGKSTAQAAWLAMAEFITLPEYPFACRNVYPGRETLRTLHGALSSA